MNLKKVRLHESIFLESLMHAHRGQKIRHRGCRADSGRHNLPLVGTIVKPRVGLDPKGMAEGASAAVRKGIDLVKDDDILAFIRAYVA